jgi:Ca2+-binding RTX toxin-like protein
MSPTDEARGFKGLQFLNASLAPLKDSDGNESNPKTGAFITPVLTFTTSNWATPQIVRFKAAPDTASEGQRFVFVNHLLKDSADLVYRDVKTLSVKVQIDDDDRKSVIITPSGRDNMVVEDGAVAGSGRTDTFNVVLSHVPKGDVKVKLNVLNNQVTLAHGADTSVNGVLELTFKISNWFTAQTVTITAPNDTIVEGFHTDTIRYTVTSDDDKEETLHSGGAPDTQVDVDGDFDLPGIQATIPPTKPTDYVLLQHRPLVDSVRVFVNGDELPDGTVDADPDQDGIQVDPDDPLSGPARFKVSGNTVTFLDAKGFAEKRIGVVRVIYDYKEAGYDNTFVKDTVVDIYDEDSPMVIVRPIEDGSINDDGSIDVVEGGATDSYTVSLSRALTGSQVVKVKAESIETRSTYGRTAIFEEQVNVNGGLTTVLEFNSSNWKTGLTVTVSAIQDDFRDGNETQVFAPDLQTVNKIRGPLLIEGAGGGGSLSLPAPLLLPHSPPVRFGTNPATNPLVPSELNILPPDGSVQAFEEGHGAGAVEFMTVLRADLRKVLEDFHGENSNIVVGSSNEDLKQLIGKTLEVSSGPGAGTVIDPSRPADLYNRFWQILDLADGATSGQVRLKLLNPSAVNPDKLFDPDHLFDENGDPAPSPVFAQPTPGTPGTPGTKYAITSLSANFFAREVDQVDYLFMFDNDSVGDDTGAFTSADGVVRQFTADSDDATKATMRVELASLIAVARLLANTSEAVVLDDLVNKTLEITVGPGEGRSWKIKSIDAVDGEPDLRELTLEDGTAETDPPIDPTINSEFRIAGGDSHGRIVGFGMGPNLLVGGRPQPGGITFGDIEVVEAHLGRGADMVRVDYATNAEDHPTRLRASAEDPTPADFYTQTIIDTGLGKDEVTIKLDANEDGAFALNLNAGDDIANATGSTAPLVIFGWDGADRITSGSGDDIIFGDRGRVDYVKTVPTDNDNNPNTPAVNVDHVITRLGHSAAPTIENPVVTGATTTTLSDATANFVKEDLVGLSVQAIGTDGHVQFRTIVNVLDNGTKLEIDRPWDQTPVFGKPDKEDNSAYHISVFPDDQTDGIFRSARLIQTIAPATGSNDTLYGGAGDDVLIGGTGNDMVDGGLSRDLIFGDIVTLDRTNTLGIYANPRFQALRGTQIYDTSTNTNAGAELVTGVSQVDPHASTFWGDLHISLNDSNFGNDYIAGGGGDDEIFGQLGNDVIQGDGSIDITNFQSQLPDGLLASWLDNTSTVASGVVGANNVDFRDLVGAGRDNLNNLYVHPSVDNPGTDGDDYIEGGPGVDTVFGNLGQDDIIGGSSDMFSLTVTARRADGSDLLFGGSGGSDIARLDAGDTSTKGHSSDSDAIVGDNGDIFRLVGVNFNGSQQIAPADGPSTLAGGLIKTSNGFLAFNYDTYDPSQKIVVRAVRLIDYTPGGLDFINKVAAAGDIGAADEIHGGKGDDFIYGGKSNDVLFGDGQNDSIIGGYGADWISGGNGDDGILGDDGRIFASRNSTSFGEPLYGIAKIEDNQINLLIVEKTGKESAVLNVRGQLKYTADLTPDNLDPDSRGSSSPNTNFRPLYANDIIYGGLGNDSIHSGAGDDAILGGEAPGIPAYVTNYDQNGNLVKVNNNSVTESDFAHPFNPGNPLGFKSTETNPTQLSKDMGKFALYDATSDPHLLSDPLRKIMLKMDGTLSKTGNEPGPNNLTWFLDFNANEGPNDGFWVPTGGVPTDGDDRIFGDLGNDWVVGGTGRDAMFPGWGNDLVNADDNLETNGGLNNRTDTNPSYNDLVYGGAGLDVLIANTGGDRMDDFVGEFNSFYVPYSNFGLPTVQRLPNPGLTDFLLQVAKNDGADLSLAAQYSAAPTRNGEPFGELGMVLQDDAAWPSNLGPPRDSQAGNLQNKADTTDNGLPIQQVAAAAAPYSTAVATITQDELDSIVAAAKQLWITALGAGDPRLAVLDQVTVLAGNLPNGMLGETTGTQIVIDRSAQGWGWFVDPTPNDNSEFAIRLSREALAASPSSPAAGRMDLLTTVVHELGNAMGFPEDHGHDVMGMVLQAGERRVPMGVRLPTVSEGAPAAVSTLGTTSTVLAGGIHADTLRVRGLEGTDTFNVTIAGNGQSHHSLVDGGLPSGKKKSTDNLNMLYTPPRPTIIHSPATNTESH